MCLLVKQSASSKFTDYFLGGVYAHNKDGIGVMYAEDSRLIVRKYLPKDEADFIAFFRQHVDGRDCVWHARMKTHGHIDMENCHPYQVLSANEGYPLYMAHNGVLSTGNAADVSKSDTWHYIRDYLRPLLASNPELFMHKAFKEVVEKHIGNNRFALMDGYGNTVIINESQGVMYEGSWLSNTYAWESQGQNYQHCGYVSAYKGGGSSYGGYRANLYNTNDYYDVWGRDAGDDFRYRPSQAVGLEKATVTPLLDNKIEAEEDDDGSLSLSEHDDLRLTFCCELFDGMAVYGMDADLIDWREAEDYYDYAGEALCRSIIDDLMAGAMDEDALVDEIVWHRNASAFHRSQYQRSKVAVAPV